MNLEGFKKSVSNLKSKLYTLEPVIPLELGIEILKHLDFPKDWKNYLLVNKCFNKFVMDNKVWIEYKELRNRTKTWWGYRSEDFSLACRFKYEYLAKYLYYNNKINIYTRPHSDNETDFRIMCENGHYDICVWFYNLLKDCRKIDIHTNGNDAFRYACENGHIQIVKWLYELSKVDDNKSMYQ